MAIRGQRPTPTALRLVKGTPPTRRRGAAVRAEPMPTGRPAPLTPLEGRPAALWASLIEPAYWLTAADGPLAYVLVHLLAEFADDPAAMNSARVAQIRAACSSLGFEPTARARLGTDARPTSADPVAHFFT